MMNHHDKTKMEDLQREYFGNQRAAKVLTEVVRIMQPEDFETKELFYEERTMQLRDIGRSHLRMTILQEQIDELYKSSFNEAVDFEFERMGIIK